MDPTSDLLVGLRDIHLPDAVPWWPPAPSWWLLAAALAFAAGYFVVRRRRARAAAPESARRAALREFNSLRRRFFTGGDAHALLAGLSALLRRTAMSLASRREVAALTGEQWLAWLDRQAGCELFARGAARAIADAPYRAQSDADVREVLRACETWLDLVSRREQAAGARPGRD